MELDTLEEQVTQVRARVGVEVSVRIAQQGTRLSKLRFGRREVELVDHVAARAQTESLLGCEVLEAADASEFGRELLLIVQETLVETRVRLLGKPSGREKPI